MERRYAFLNEMEQFDGDSNFEDEFTILLKDQEHDSWKLHLDPPNPRTAQGGNYRRQNHH